MIISLRDAFYSEIILDQVSFKVTKRYIRPVYKIDKDGKSFISTLYEFNDPGESDATECPRIS